MRGIAVVAALLCACSAGSAPPGGQPPGTNQPPAGKPLVSLTITGEGRVFSSPAGLDCGVSCGATFPEGTALNLTPAPAAGWSFEGWTGLCGGSGTQSCLLTLTGTSLSIGATFKQNPPPPPPPPPSKPAKLYLQFLRQGGTVTSSPAGMQCTTSCAGSFALGTAVALTATAAPGFTAAGFGSGAVCSANQPCTFTITMVGDTTAQVDFAPIPRVTLSVALSGNGAGTVVSTPGGIACGNGGGACSAQFYLGTPVTLTQSTPAGQFFLSWSGACHGSGACAMTMAADASVSATFLNARADCAPLAANPAPARWVGLAYGFSACADAFEDDQGTYGLHAIQNDGKQQDWFFYSAGGQYLTSDGYGGTQMDWQQQPQGALGVFDHSMIGYRDAGQGVLNFVQAPTPASTASDPTGGLLLVQTSQAFMYRAGPVLRWGPVRLASSGGVVGSGVDLGGRSLIITDGSAHFGRGSYSAEWLGPDGVPTTGEFLLASNFTPGTATWFEARPLIGGGLAVRRVDGDTQFYTSQWLAVVRANSDTVEPAPDWLASRPDTDLHVVRGGRGYALAPDPARNTDCAQTLEVFTPYGATCSTARLRMTAGTCDTHRMSVGRSGSLFQTWPDASEPPAPPNLQGFQCTWNRWQNLLR